MRVGPSLGQRLPPTLAGDGVVVVLIVVFALLALLLHDSVGDLGNMARGMRDTGTAIQVSGASTANEVRSSVGQAAGAVSAVPLVGGDVARSVRETGERSAESIQRETRIDGGRLVVAGRQGMDDAQRTARLIGWFAFLVPTALLLVQWLPQRLAARRGPEED